MAVTEVEQALEVARLRQHDSAVHHRGLDDHPGDAPVVLDERALSFREVVERHHADEIRERLRDPHRLRHRGRILPRTDQRRVGATENISES